MRGRRSRQSWDSTSAVVLAAVLLAASNAEAQRGGRGRGAQEEAPPADPAGPIYTPPSSAMNVSGVWWTQRYTPKIQVIGGGDLPYSDRGKAEYARNIAGLKNGSVRD